MSVNVYDKETKELTKIAGEILFANSPIGSIVPYGGSTAPSGWLLCDGSELLKANYPDLYAAIGDDYGTPSDTDHFVLPTEFNHNELDLSYTDIRSLVGANAANAYTMPYDAYISVSGSGWSQNYCSISVISNGETHAFNFAGSYDSASAAGGTAIFVKKGDKIYASANNSSRAMYIKARYFKKYCIIKSYLVGVPSDFMSRVDEAVQEANTYRTSETVVGKWIDGKPIYRKCFSFNRIIVNSDAAWHTVITASSIPGVSKLLNYKLIADTADWTVTSLARFYSGNFQIYPCAGLNISIDTVILEYTKTTD